MRRAAVIAMLALAVAPADLSAQRKRGGAVNRDSGIVNREGKVGTLAGQEPRPNHADSRLPTPDSRRSRVAQKPADYDETFRKYSKRYFGPAYDWKLFKAQGMTESNLDVLARSRVGARGVMQLMPSTFRAIQSENEELKWIDDPHMNIAAGIQYDRKLWLLWEADSITDHRTQFMFGSYNAGRRTLLRAQGMARRSKLDPRVWPSIRTVAPQVPRWRHKETLEYIERIRTAREGLGKGP